MPSIVRKKITYSGNIHDTQPVGEIINFDNEIPPAGYLPCDGRSVLKSKYPELFKKIGIKYGSEDDLHFNLPSDYDVGKNSMIKIEEDLDENFNDDTYIHVNGKDEKNPKKIIVKKIVKLLDYIKNKLINDDKTTDETTWSSEKIQDELDSITPESIGAQNTTNAMSYRGVRESGTSTAFLEAIANRNKTSSPATFGSVMITDGPNGTGNYWYNYIYIPHRAGIGSDSYMYGTLILMTMTINNNKLWLNHYISGNWNGWQLV